MVARLKLKEIDGRAPPGVNNATALLQKASFTGLVVCPGKWPNLNASLF
jgi:hypothetical protein